MSDPTAQEPTMEEILASIRRIISEDDAPAAEAPAAVAVAEAPAPAPHEEPKPEPVKAAAPAPVHHPEPEDEDILELTDPEPTPAETHGDLDVFAPAPKAAYEPEPEPVKAAPPPPPPPEPAYQPTYDPEPLGGSLTEDEPLLGGGARMEAAGHFGRLSSAMAMPAPGMTLDAVVRELLRPLLKDWLDEHLPSIVEEKVQAEVDRVARRRV
jgi:cell pole-organizing protein PopZ